MTLQDSIELIPKYRCQFAAGVLATVVIVQFLMLRAEWNAPESSPPAKQNLRDELTYLHHLERLAQESKAEREKTEEVMNEAPIVFKNDELYQDSKELWIMQAKAEVDSHRAVTRQRAKIDELMQNDN